MLQIGQFFHFCQAFGGGHAPPPPWSRLCHVMIISKAQDLEFSFCTIRQVRQTNSFPLVLQKVKSISTLPPFPYSCARKFGRPCVAATLLAISPDVYNVESCQLLLGL